MENKKGRYTYSDNEKEILKALKMQEEKMKNLSSQATQQEEDLSDIRRRIEILAKKKGIELPKEQIKTSLQKMTVQRDTIPTWDEVMDDANSMVSEDIILEDLLSKEEFQFCIEEVKRINDEFARMTQLNKTDLCFIVVATALQTLRWVILQELCGDLGQEIDPETRLDHDDKSIKDNVKQRNKYFQDVFEGHGHCESIKKYKSWEQIIFSSAPYDTTVGSPALNINMEGKFHRYKTLGHDPILGWFFGTANFITDTITLSNLSSYRISRVGTPHFDTPTNLGTILYETFDSVREDWLRLPAGIFAQFVHLESDALTKLGLPIPVIEMFSESLAGELYKGQYDSLCLMKDIAIVGKQAVISHIINMLIGLVHGMFYNETKDGERKYYEARTRKILSISNSLSAAGNITYSIISEDWRKLDIGGILVTITRLFSDVRYITRLKKEYIEQALDNKEVRDDIDSYFK